MMTRSGTTGAPSLGPGRPYRRLSGHNGPATRPRRRVDLADAPAPLPGAAGEHHLQELYGTRGRAETFYRQQVLDVLTPRMAQFLARQTVLIVSSVDAEGAPEVSVRFGEPGFVAVLDERTLAWPELRGDARIVGADTIYAEHPKLATGTGTTSARRERRCRGARRRSGPRRRRD